MAVRVHEIVEASSAWTGLVEQISGETDPLSIDEWYASMDPVRTAWDVVWDDVLAELPDKISVWADRALAWKKTCEHLQRTDAWSRKCKVSLAEYEQHVQRQEQTTKTHPGIRELGQIEAALDAGWSAWPNLSELDAKRDEVMNVYKARETCGLLVREPWSLARACRPGDGFEKREPYVFNLDGPGGATATLIGYHAPSDSPGNSAARASDFAALKDVCAEAAKDAPAFLLGDLNVDTSVTTLSNVDGSGVTPEAFLEDVTGVTLAGLGQAEMITSLRRSAIETGAGGAGTWAYRNKAFDKIYPLNGSDGGAEAVDVVDYLRADAAGAARAGEAAPGTPSAERQSRVTKPGAGPLSPGTHAPAATGPVDEVAQLWLLRGANRVSDHLPVVWTPAGGGGASAGAGGGGSGSGGKKDTGGT